MGIYMDNAATSYPKPESVYQEMDSFLRNLGVSAGRGAYSKALEADRILFSTRRALGELFHIHDTSRIVFTKNITESLNLALKGLLKEGDHVLTSKMEHNSLWRPLMGLQRRKKITVTPVKTSKEGLIDLKEMEDAIMEKTRLIAITHASNLLGTIIPLEEIMELAAKYNLITLLDTAQTAGSIPIHVEKTGIHLLAFTGHKGLFGPPGTGGLYLHPKIQLKPLLEGGTGSDSFLEEMPPQLPDALEAGTLNMVGLSGLKAGVRFILEEGQSKIREKEIHLTSLLLKGLQEIDRIRIYGPLNARDRVSLVSFNLEGIEAHRVAYLLDQVFGIMVRAGLHCTPKAHELCGTEKTGSVRVGLSYFNQEEEIKTLLKALRELEKKAL